MHAWGKMRPKSVWMKPAQSRTESHEELTVSVSRQGVRKNSSERLRASATWMIDQEGAHRSLRGMHGTP